MDLPWVCSLIFPEWCSFKIKKAFLIFSMVFSMKIMNVPWISLVFRMFYSKVDSMEELFELLDVDGGGTLSLAEFLDGLLLVPGTPIDPDKK